MELSGTPSQKSSPQDSMEEKKVVWESSEEEEGVALEADKLKKLMGTPYNRKFEEKREKEEAALRRSGIRTERDIFGRVSAKHRSAWKYRKQNYGANYNLFSGEEVPSIHRKVAKKEHGSPVVIDYRTDMYDTNGNNLNSAVTVLDNLLALPDDYWKMATPSALISRMTTSRIQQVVCAAINSRSKLVWLFGVDIDFSKVEGCVFAEGRFHTFMQGLEYALTHEFFPALEPLVKITAYPIAHPSGDECHMIKLTLDCTVDTLYQLSSGRVYYRSNDSPILLPILNDARDLLLERRRADIEQKQGQERVVRLPKAVADRLSDYSQDRNFLIIATAVGSLLGFLLG